MRYRPIRILHLIDSDGLYGAERMLLTLGTESQALGHDVSVGTIVAPHDRDDPLGDAARARGIKHTQFHMHDGFDIGGLRKILRYASANGIQIIHTHGYKATIMIAFVPRPWLPCPVVTTLHGWTSAGKIGKLAAYETLERWLLSRIDAVVVVSDAIRRRLLKHVDAKRIRLILNGIDFAAIEPTREDVASACSPSLPKVLAIGRLSYEKGFDILLEAMKMLRDNRVTFELTIVGEGSERPALMQLARDRGLAGSVTFTGYVDNVRSLYARASALAIPSRSEGLPLVLLEAMGAGVPVIATRVGEIPNVLDGGTYGTLIEPDSAAELAESLREVLTHPLQAAKRATLSKAHALANYAGRGMAERYSQVYEGIAK